MLFKRVFQLVLDVCLIANLQVAKGSPLIQFLSKSVLVEVISFKGSRNLVVKASLFNGRLRLTRLCSSDNLWPLNQSVQKRGDVLHQLRIFFFNLNVTLIANPLLCAFASCVLQAMHRIAAGWADNWDFQQVDSRLPIRTCLCVTRCLSAPQSLKRCFVNDLWIGGISKVSVIIHDPHNPGFIPCDNTRGELHFV